MKILSTSALILGLSSFGNTQIVLTSSDFATAGNEELVSTQLGYTGDFTSTGANYYWNFNDLVPTMQELIVHGSMSQVSGLPNVVFGSFAPANYKASYFVKTDLPLDQIGGFLPVELDNIQQYTKVSTSAITSLGYSMSLNGTAIPIKSDTIETRYALPLAYGNTHFSRGYTKLNMNPILDAQWIQHRTRTTVADGWGTLKTPYGINQVLRLKHTITESDSIYYSGTWIPIPVPTTVEYEWWANNERVPLLRIVTAQLAGTETITRVEYKDNVWLGLNDKEEINARIYPNPSSEMLNVELNNTAQKIELIDVAGKVVLSDDSPKMNNNYSVEHLKTGVYQLKITSNEKVTVSSVVKN